MMTRKKFLFMPFFVLLFCAVPFCAAAKNADADTIAFADRVDFTLTADEEGGVTGDTTGITADTVNTKNGKKAKTKAAAMPNKPDPWENYEKTGKYDSSMVGVNYFELDLMSISRSIAEQGFDADFSFGDGDYKNFGLGGTVDIYGIYKYKALIIQMAINLNLNWYPLGNAPASWYVGPLFGAGFALYDNLPRVKDGVVIYMPLGVSTGYRFKFGGFLMDTSVEYTYNICFTSAFVNNTYSNFMFKIGTGWYYFDRDPLNATDAGKSQKAAKKYKEGGDDSEK